MRFRNTFCALFLAAAPAAMAQEGASEKAPIGLIIGLNSASLTGDFAGDDASRRMGILLGVNTVWRFSPMIGIQPELLFSQQGGKMMRSIEGDVHEVTLKLNYVRIPVLARIDVGSGGMGLHLVGGPSLDYRLNCNANAEGAFDTSLKCNDSPGQLGANFEDWVFGAMVGGGIGLNLMQRSVSLGARYHTSFASLLKDDLDMKNPVISFLITIGL